MHALSREDASGSPEEPERSAGAAERLDAPTAVRHPAPIKPIGQSGKSERLSREIIRETHGQIICETTTGQLTLRFGGPIPRKAKGRRRKRAVKERIARLRIELQELEPKIWRRIDMPLSTTLEALRLPAGGGFPEPSCGA